MLTVNQLRKSYQSGTNHYEVLKDISFSINQGEFVAIMGPSGSGKTTLLNCISCFTPVDQGEIKLGDKQINQLNEEQLAQVRNEQLGFVFQDFMLLDGISVMENICMPRIIQGTTEFREMERDALVLMKLFGIDHIKHKYPAEISGGEKQRTAVARALLNNPLLILADEPTGNLDSKSSRAVIDAFIQAKNELKATIFMVTHDSYAASFSDRVILLRDGKVHQELKQEHGQQAFMDQLLETLKEMSGDRNEA